ncbi:hypothetical protein AB5J52_38755 [Streptomyces sp. R39]|uniref:Uncharacterized protein n=1 Tax=Streptomyces sp. R39 TaxID=3238631 RepID=A0AB39QVS9_9ACTN
MDGRGQDDAVGCHHAGPELTSGRVRVFTAGGIGDGVQAGKRQCAQVRQVDLAAAATRVSATAGRSPRDQADGLGLPEMHTILTGDFLP